MLAKGMLLLLSQWSGFFAPMWGIFGGCEARICADAYARLDQAPFGPILCLQGRCILRLQRAGGAANRAASPAATAHSAVSANASERA
jgi:hypothetical protein